jgi:membrane-associated phospholipid phosphatase
MPSYHTVMALLIAYAFRRTGVVGYVIAALNAAMLLSIPSIGGHYLVDVLAGGVLAFAAITVWRATHRVFSRYHSSGLLVCGLKDHGRPQCGERTGGAADV